MHVLARIAGSTLVGLCLVPLVMGQEPAPDGAAAQPKAERPPAKAQPRPHGQRVKVDPALVTVEDGDGVVIRWTGAGRRDRPDPGHRHARGPAARAQPAVRPALRPGSARVRAGGVRRRDRGRAAPLPDPRPLRPDARLSVHQRPQLLGPGDQGAVFHRDGQPLRRQWAAREAAEVKAAAKDIGPLPFEPPHLYRARMRDLTNWMKQNGQYPAN